jgi:exopolyphosphatase/pppGpp-phosphohydrolase
VGGTASNLVKVVPGVPGDRILTPARLDAAFETLCAASAADIATRFGIRPQRARILAAGAAILEAILARYGMERATASEEGIREGLVLALARAGAGWRDRLDALAHGWGGDSAITAD